MKCVVDNDVLLKGSCYGLLEEITAAIAGQEPSGVLGAARFIVPRLIQRRRLTGGPNAALATFDRFLMRSETIEPTIQEQGLAAQLESTAQSLALNLDTGESQLVAILVRRAIPLLLTGDKRAIAAIERLLDTDPQLEKLIGAVRCLEQLIQTTVETADAAEIRKLICAEPAVDKTLTICFGCASAAITTDCISEGLNSYIADIRKAATRVLSI
jgi:hypothetical protein